MRLLQAALREPFLQDETFAQDQPKKSFFWGPLPKTLHRRYSHRGACALIIYMPYRPTDNLPDGSYERCVHV